MIIDFDIFTMGLLMLIYVPIFCILKWKMKKSRSYLIAASIFYVYLCGVLKYTQFPIMVGYSMDYDIFKDANYVPLINLTVQDLKTSILNVILGVPFGFFLTLFCRRSVVKTAGYGVLFGVVIETVQVLIAMFIGTNMRVLDINDVIFNALGVVIGFALYQLYQICVVEKFYSSDK